MNDQTRKFVKGLDKGIAETYTKMINQPDKVVASSLLAAHTVLMVLRNAIVETTDQP